MKKKKRQIFNWKFLLNVECKSIWVSCILDNVRKCKVNVVCRIHQEKANDTNNRFHVGQSKFFRSILQSFCNLFSDFHRAFRSMFHDQNLSNPKTINRIEIERFSSLWLLRRLNVVSIALVFVRSNCSSSHSNDHWAFRLRQALPNSTVDFPWSTDRFDDRLNKEIFHQKQKLQFEFYS